MTDIPVIGIDPGIVTTAIAGPHGADLLKPKKPRRLHDLCRLLSMSQIFVPAHRVMPVVILEDLPPFGKSVTAVQGLGFAHGVIRMTLESAMMPYATVAPTTLKKYVTGSGNADKDSMLWHAQDILGYEGKDHNAADALWLREIGRVLTGQSEPHEGAFIQALAPEVKSGKTRHKVNDWPFPINWNALTERYAAA